MAFAQRLASRMRRAPRMGKLQRGFLSMGLFNPLFWGRKRDEDYLRDMFKNGEPGAVFIAQKPNDLYARQNILLWSEDLSNAAWIKGSGSAASTTFTPDTTNNIHRINQATNTSASLQPGQAVTVSGKVKSSTIGWAYINTGATFGASITVNLTTGAISGAGGASLSNQQSVLNADGSVSFQYTGVYAGVSNVIFIQANKTVSAATDETYTGNGTDNLQVLQIDVRKGTAAGYQKVTDWTTEFLAAVGNFLTMYSDDVGTTPVTALEQNIGLQLDVKPIFLGPNLLGADGQFASATNWSAGGGWSITGGQAVNSGSVGTLTYTGSNFIVAGRKYQVDLDSFAGSGVVNVVFGGSDFQSISSAVGHQAKQFIAGLPGSFALQGGGPYTLDNISVREVISAPNALGQPLRSAELLSNPGGPFTSTSGWAVTVTASAITLVGNELRLLMTDTSSTWAGRVLNILCAPNTTYEMVVNARVDSAYAGFPGMLIFDETNSATLKNQSVAFSTTTGRYMLKATTGPTTRSISLIMTQGSNAADVGKSIYLQSASMKLIYGAHRAQSSVGARAKLSARYNKVVTPNANPLSYVGGRSGDAAATITVVNDAAAIAAAPAELQRLCTLGNVYKLDNSTGTTPAYAFPDITPAGSTNLQQISAWMRLVGAQSANTGLCLSVNGAAAISVASGGGYTKYTSTGAPNAASKLQFQADAGRVLYFILYDMREACYSYLPTPQVVWDATTGYDDTGFPAQRVYSGAQGDLTAAQDFSACQQAQVWLAWSKLSDAGYGVCMDLALNPADSTTYPNTFNVGAGTLFGDATRRTWGAFMAGSAQAGLGGFVYTSPDIRVLSAQFDCTKTGAANEITLRLNGAAPTSTDTGGSSDSNASAFGNWPMCFGSRGATGVTNPFTGGEFMSIVRGGPAPADAAVAAVERVCKKQAGNPY